MHQFRGHFWLAIVVSDLVARGAGLTLTRFTWPDASRLDLTPRPDSG